MSHDETSQIEIMWDGGLLTQTNNYDSQSFSKSRLWRLFLGCGHCVFYFFPCLDEHMWRCLRVLLHSGLISCVLHLVSVLSVCSRTDRKCFADRWEVRNAAQVFHTVVQPTAFFFFRLLLFYLFIHVSRFRHVKLKPREPQTLSDCLLSYRFTLRFPRHNVILQEGSIDLLEFPLWNAAA